jgi:GNAT superfamily N-acetyltransferase
MATTPTNRPPAPLSTVPGLTIRPALPADAETILLLVRGLADYEQLPPPDRAAQDRLIRDMFSTPPRIQAFLAEYEGVAAGYTFIFETYSSFLAFPTLYLEDLFVLPGYRKKKVGYALFVAMVAEAHRRGCGRMEWSVLDWNTLAIDFYKRLGATHLKEWHVYRLGRNDMEDIIATGGGRTVTPP